MIPTGTRRYENVWEPRCRLCMRWSRDSRDDAMEREVFDEDDFPTLRRLVRGQVLLTGIGSFSCQCIRFFRLRCHRVPQTYTTNLEKLIMNVVDRFVLSPPGNALFYVSSTTNQTKAYLPTSGRAQNAGLPQANFR